MHDRAPADHIFRGGHVWTGVPGAPPVEAVAVRDGRILALGSAREVERHRDSHTEHVAIGDGLLLPAFADAHCHPLWGGLATMECDLSGAHTPEAWFELITDYAMANPSLHVISGEGWSPYRFPDGLPHRRQLDAVVPDRPVVLGSFDGHSTWANSAALAAADIDATTPDPPRGHIERDADGEPIGVFHEAARGLVERIKPAPDASRLAEALRRGQAYLHGLGITAWLDAIVDPTDEAVYLDLAGQGELTGRAVMALRWDPDRGLAQLADLEARRRAIDVYGHVQLRPSAVKLFADGVVESSTAALLEPYADGSATDPDGLGAAIYAPDDLTSICAALGAAEFDIHAHAIGDRAVRDVLDALTATKTAGPQWDSRHAIAHLELVADPDIPRFAGLGVIAACQPLWAVHDESDTILGPRLGASRLERRYPFGRLRDAGAQLAMGSDWNVSTADPLQIMHAAIMRTPSAATEAVPLGPAAERLSFEEALTAYTGGSARALRLEREMGSIEVGKSADLVLLEGDPSTAGVNLPDCRVRMTLASGRVVHAA